MGENGSGKSAVSRTALDEDQTFVFADLAGFTALTEAHGNEQAADLAAEFADLVRELLPAHGAKEVKAIGDAMMLRVERADQAVLLGSGIVAETRSRSRFPAVHIGMDTGPATERGGDWFGATVNVAARVAGAAGGNEVLITEATHAAAGSVEKIEFARRPPQHFHNVSEPVGLFAVRGAGDSSGALPIDPVCRMAIDADHCAGCLIHNGVEYCFCSLECARAFASSPDTYT
jgi:class 3 adenylate cyclase